MNAKSVDLFVVVIIVCIITPNVYGIENNEWINNQSDNIVVQEIQPEIQNFISAPDAIVGFNNNAINETAIDYKDSQFYPLPFSINDIAQKSIFQKENKTAVDHVRRKPQFTSGFQMLRRSVASMVEKIQYFVQSIWNFFSYGKSESCMQ